MSLVCHAQFTDDFSDGDFTENPTWSGDDSLFVVENQTLRSQRDGAFEYGLSTPSSLVDDAQWEFWINLNFATSGANFVDVFLMADDPDMEQVQNGYFVRLGGTPDEISLFAVVGGTETKIIDGPDGAIGGSSNNIFVIRTSRTEAGAWTLEADEDATGVFELVGTVTDVQTDAATHFGFRITQSNAASPINNHFFDYFTAAPIPVDTTAPQLVSAEAVSATEVMLTFDEAVEEVSAQDPGHYYISDIGNPISASRSADQPAEVSLTLGEEMESGVIYTVVVNGVADPAGNVTEDASAEFLFYTVGIAEYKDMVFNEIMADPTPPVGLPEAEYLELFNTGEEYFNLEGWTLVNTTTPKTLSAALIPPGGYVILCDAQYVSDFEPYGLTVGIPSFTALANSGDSLTLLSPEGTVVDVVQYTDDWYGDSEFADGGYALELINPHTPCGGSTNWTASEAADGGTPGAENSVYDDTPDTTPPLFENFTIPQADRISLQFSEPLDEASVNVSAFTIEPPIEIVEATTVGGDRVLLQLAQNLAVGVNYELTIDEVADCEGNAMSTPVVVSILIGESPQLHDVLITEIMADPTPSVGLPEAEYFELYNTTDHAIEMQGCVLSGVVFAESIILSPGEYLAFASEQNRLAFLTVPEVRFLEDMSTVFLTNGGRELFLTNPEGARVDRVMYDLSWYGDPDKEDGGYALERINVEEPCRGGDNWTASTSENGGTPGSPNSVANTDPDITPPVLEAVFVRDSVHIELVFSEVIDSLSVLTATVELDPEIAIVSVDNIPPAYTRISVVLAEPLTPGHIHELTVDGIADCVGNPMSGSAVLPLALPESVEPGDLIINEVLFNPSTGGSDFVELVNVSNKVLTLKNLLIENASGTTQEITDDPVLVFPGQYVVLTPDPDQLISEYPLGRRENFLRVESLPSFPNTSGSVILTDVESTEFDRFDYMEDYHFPLLATFKGVSLERLSFTRPTNDPDNWSSAAENVGFATPGYLNSQYLPEQMASSEFELQKEVFSPDNDGFDDVLYINYRFSQAGWVTTIRIFDRHGRLVRRLKNNAYLGTGGTISWDGTTDDRTKARIGPHIILIEAYRPQGGVETFKIPCVVAGRLAD